MKRLLQANCMWKISYALFAVWTKLLSGEKQNVSSPSGLKPSRLGCQQPHQKGSKYFLMSAKIYTVFVIGQTYFIKIFFVGQTPLCKYLSVDVHKLFLQIFGLFWPPSPWLTALLNKICQIYLVTLTFHEPPLPPLL